MFVPRLAGEGMQSKLVGKSVLGGERHGRAVTITIGGSQTETHLSGAYPEFELKGHRQRVKADGPVPAPVANVLDGLGASSRWTSMRVRAGSDGILVSRRTGPDQPWLHDLWLAESVASSSTDDG